MKKVQVIGLPCSGKSTAIKKFLDQTELKINYIDIKNFKGRNRERSYKSKIARSKRNIIAESACGIKMRNTTVVKLEIDTEVLYTRSIKRDSQLDEDYLSILNTNMTPPKYTVKTEEALIDLLKKLIKE